ncbi:MAG: hypothetical protein R2883_07500 [Caldisericia bacterium]
MGKNTLTSWLVVAGKDFKVLFKNRSLFLIFMGVVIALITLAVFQGTVLLNTLYDSFDASDYLPMLPNYMIYFVIFASTLYMMNLGPVSFTNEHQTGTVNRLKIQNVSMFSVSFGKIVFFYTISIILTLVFNASVIWFFLEESYKSKIPPMGWTTSTILIHILLWPLMMVLGAYLIYLVISLFNHFAKKR